VTQYYVSADQEFESGVYKYNDLSRLNLRTNLTANFTPKINSAITLGYVKSGLGLPQNDNNNLGILSGGLLGNPSYDAARLGYLTRRPDSLYALRSNQDIDRFTGWMNTTYNPVSFLRVVGTLGYDALNRHDTQTLPANRITNNTNNRNGFRSSNVYQIFNYTANLSATATSNLTQDIVSTTTLGTQFRRDEFTGTQGFGRVLVAGTSTLNGTSTLFAVGEDLIDNRTIGYYIPEDAPQRAEIPVTPTATQRLADYKPAATSAVVEAFDPSQANIDKRTQRLTFGDLKVALLPKQNRGNTVQVQTNFRWGDEKTLNGRTVAGELAGAMLTRGTSKMTRQQIADEMTRLQMTGGLFGFQTTREHLPDALTLSRTG
jgi:hypothetical protein